MKSLPILTPRMATSVVMIGLLASSACLVRGSKASAELSSSQERDCEVCQSLALIITKELVDQLPSNYFRLDKTGKKGSNRVNLGLIDVALLDLLDAEKTCTFHKMKDFADKSDKFKVHEMTATCKVLLDKHIEKFETLTATHLHDDALSKAICTEGCPNGLWLEHERPENRETQQVKNARESDEFLAKNREQEGWNVTDSGLQYKVIELESTDASLCPSETDSEVEVDYTGSLAVSGKVFDSSLTRGETAQFGLNQVVRGFAEALRMMCEGDHYEFVFPSNLGYGTTGSGDNIPPNAALRFDLKLHKIIKGGRAKKESGGNERKQIESDKQDEEL